MRQAARFGVVGGVAFAVDYGLLMLLTQALGVAPVPAAAASFLASLAVNYSLSMRYVFSGRPGMSRRREMAVFAALSGVGLMANELCVWAGTSMLGDGPAAVTATKVAATAVVMLWNFLSRRRWLDGGL